MNPLSYAGNILSTVMRGSSPEEIPSQAWFPEGFRKPRISTAEQLLQAARERLKNAGGAARMKMREQEEQGVRSYVPVDQLAADDELRRRALDSNIPMPDVGQFHHRVPTEMIRRPTGGVVASYGPQERVVTSRYGTGSATAPTGKPATFDGRTKDQFFGSAAVRQGKDNKYAYVLDTGKTDARGIRIQAAKAIPKGSDAGTERIYEAMKQGGAKGKEKKKD